jgi:hypothetical protein
MLVALASSTGVWLAVTGVLAVWEVVTFRRLSASRREHARVLARTTASYLRALVLLRMRCAPRDRHYTTVLVQELQVRGEALQQALDQLRQERRIVGPLPSEPGVHYGGAPRRGVRIAAVRGQRRESMPA